MLPWGQDARPRPLFERLCEDPWRLAMGMSGGGPVVEVFERGEDIVIRAEVAGIEPQDLDVRRTDDAVTIRGERRAEQRSGPDGYYHSERRYGAFARTISLPAPVDSARAQARVQHGLLEVVAPRRSDGGPGRRLSIEAQ